MAPENSNGELHAATVLGVRLKEKVCIITGAASGLGEAAAHLFASHGAHIIVADVQDAVGQAVAAALPPPGRHIYLHCDVSKEADVAAAVDLAVSTFGRLDVMFNNAAVIADPMPLPALDINMWDRIQAVNVRGVALGMKHAARVMSPARRGCIINTTSLAANLVSEEGGLAYSASKHAVLGMTKAGAVELGKFGVRVNSVAPYIMLTPMVMPGFQKINLDKESVKAMISMNTVLKGHFLEAQDVAEAALYLASDEARYINGHNLAVDGGMSIASRTLIPPHVQSQN